MPIQLPGPMTKILKKYMPDEVTLRKVVITEDPDWGMPTYTTTDYAEITASTFPINYDDLSFLPPGLVHQGDIWLMMLGEYRVGSALITPEVGDRLILEEAGDEFEIRIMSYIIHGPTVVTRTAYARRLNE